MQARQFDREQYFNEQSYTTEKYVIPYISSVMNITTDTNVAEIGCGEGGNLKPFLDRGCGVVGVDLSDWKISYAEKFFENHTLRKNLRLINDNVYNIIPENNFKFNLIFLRDTLEHIHDQERLLKYLKFFLKPSGKIFLSFPPWRMPFGGHQQMCNSKFLSKLPYFHILPSPLFRSILRLFGEQQDLVDHLLETKETGISIQKFLKILSNVNFKIEKNIFYIINPNYEVKFKLKPLKLPFFLNIPFLRDFFVTTIYCIISVNDESV
jgi:SAM-dependent methyltransferase